MDQPGSTSRSTIESARIRVVKPDQHHTQTAQTPGFVRRELVAAPGAWLGTMRTPPGNVSGWHHHGDRESYIYVLAGRVRLEFGPAGRETCEGEPGDLLIVPRGAVHRERNPAADENAALVVRVGAGELVVNVDGPSAG
jgi:uncharacterized RmlC-like cupin family protein